MLLADDLAAGTMMRFTIVTDYDWMGLRATLGDLKPTQRSQPACKQREHDSREGE